MHDWPGEEDELVFSNIITSFERFGKYTIPEDGEEVALKSQTGFSSNAVTVFCIIYILFYMHYICIHTQ